MLTRNDFTQKYPSFHEGMDAYDVDGDKLGKVVEIGDDSLTIEKGFFLPKDFSIRYDDVVDIRNERLILNQKSSDLENWKDEKYPWLGRL